MSEPIARGANFIKKVSDNWHDRKNYVVLTGVGAAVLGVTATVLALASVVSLVAAGVFIALIAAFALAGSLSLLCIGGKNFPTLESFVAEFKECKEIEDAQRRQWALTDFFEFFFNNGWTNRQVQCFCEEIRQAGSISDDDKAEIFYGILRNLSARALDHENTANDNLCLEILGNWYELDSFEGDHLDRVRDFRSMYVATSRAFKERCLDKIVEKFAERMSQEEMNQGEISKFCFCMSKMHDEFSWNFLDLRGFIFRQLLDKVLPLISTINEEEIGVIDQLVLHGVLEGEGSEKLSEKLRAIGSVCGFVYHSGCYRNLVSSSDEEKGLMKNILIQIQNKIKGITRENLRKLQYATCGLEEQRIINMLDAEALQNCIDEYCIDELSS